MEFHDGDRHYLRDPADNSVLRVPAKHGGWADHGWRQGLTVPDAVWAAAFLLPYAAVFLAFVAYPLAFGVWLGSDPAVWRDLLANPRYPRVVANTLLFAGLGVNLKMVLALLLSGFLMHRRVLLGVFMLPWALPALAAFLSLHWMFIGYGGFINSALDALFGIEGPIWFNAYWLALGANIAAYVWKWLPFWTLVFIAGRMAIPRDVLDAAAVDGATGYRCFVYVTFPLLANLYLMCTLLATLWAVGDFSTAYFVSGGAPALMTEVLGTYGFRVGLIEGRPALAAAAGLSALPVLIPIAVMLIRRLDRADAQL